MRHTEASAKVAICFLLKNLGGSTTLLHHEKKGGYFNPLESMIEKKNAVRWLGPPYSDLNWGLDLVSSAIFFSMHIWNLIHDAPFHCHRNVTAPSRKYRVSPSLSCSTKCHSWTSSVWHEGRKEKSEIERHSDSNSSFWWLNSFFNLP